MQKNIQNTIHKEDRPYLEQLSANNPVGIRLYYLSNQQAFNLKIYHYGQILSLSTILPILHNLGLRPKAENNFRVVLSDKTAWVHDFLLEELHNLRYPPHFTLIEEGFQKIWHGEVENDQFNCLITFAQLTWQQVIIVRAWAYYLSQTKIPYPINYMAKVCSAYPTVIRELVRLFEHKFTLQHSNFDNAHIEDLLRAAQPLEYYHVLRLFFNLLQATVRTTFFQAISPQIYLAFKFNSRQIESLPPPIPLFEIFIYSPRFQAIHLRSAKVARGGIRWSNRPADFRTETLSLLKAQNVKNSIIVPLGAKGSFVLKEPQAFESLPELTHKATECYQLMIQAMLALTDNQLEGKVVGPPNVVRYDEDDPYLVVAADKGTAGFSDLANDIAKQNDFWLDDAFASGGSRGYSHKKTGITSKGAFESIKHHFYVLGRDIQSEAFTVAGVGDMAGDVFGNAMLLSRRIKLIAAFNAQHIFLDPHPDPETAFSERQRLYKLPLGGWDSYDRKLLSQGGDIFSREQQAIRLSREIKSVLAVEEDILTPEALVQAILKAPVDLLWFGGIGTFVKALRETHAEVNDSFNDRVRVSASELRAKVIAEGANLGMTQKARIEYALLGGKINADFIDNAGGVNCSDHEVNIKILLQRLVKEQLITPQESTLILKKTSKEVSCTIVYDVYLQNQILFQLERLGASAWGRWQYLIRVLQDTSGLDPDLEYIPDDSLIEQRRTHAIGPTRPELAVLLAYTKNSLTQQILSYKIEANPLYASHLLQYFPTLLRKNYSEAILAHPLAREILATVLANMLINRMGPLFVLEMSQALGHDLKEILQAFVVSYQWLNLDKLWPAIESHKVTIGQKYQALHNVQRVVRLLMLYFLQERIEPAMLPNITELHLDEISPRREKLAPKWKLFSPAVASQLSDLPLFPAVILIDRLSKFTSMPFKAVAQLYHEANQCFSLERFFQVLQSRKRETDWQDTMRLQLFDEFIIVQTQLMLSIITVPKGIAYWQEKLERFLPILNNLPVNAELTYLAYVLSQLKRLLNSNSRLNCPF